MNGPDGFARELAAVACRALHFGVPPGDFRRAAEAGGWSGWSASLAVAGERYQAAADAARATRRVSAAELGRRAAACFHYAQLRLSPGPDRDRLAVACRQAYAGIAGLLSPPARPVTVPSPGGFLPGYARRARPGAPWVVLINGLDSAKEVELDRFAEGFLARGNSVFYLDTPGLGEAPGPFRVERFDAAMAALLDRLSWAEGAAPVGIFGVSFGGHLACRVAAREPRVAACVCLGGFHDSTPLRRLPPSARERLRQACGLPPGTGEEPDLGALTLAPLAGLAGRPLLVLHGTADPLVDGHQVEALEVWGGQGAEVRFLEGAEHACTDRFGDLLPEVWDWMTARLAGRPRDAEAPADRPSAFEEVLP